MHTADVNLHAKPSPIRRHAEPIFRVAIFFILPYREMFVSLHRLSRAKALCKKSIAILSLLVNSPNLKLEDEHFMLSLDCIC